MAENSTNNTKKNNKILSIIRVAVYTLAAMTVLFIIAGVLSKYVFKETGTSAFGAAEFYFESDYLSEEGEIFDIQAKEISFAIYNYPDNLRYASADIDYTLSIEQSKHTNTAPVISSTSGTLKGGEASKTVITISKLTNGVSYTVTVRGEAGFEKTLKATFSVAADTSKMYKWVDDENEYVNLTVWVEGNTLGNVLINFPQTLLPDNTDPIMRTTKVGEQVVDRDNFSQGGSVTYGSYTYRFFKTDLSKRYTAEDFTVFCQTSAINQTEVKSIKKPVK